MTAWTNPATGKTAALPDGWVQSGVGFFINGPLWAICASEPDEGRRLEDYAASFLSQCSHRFKYARTEISADGQTLFLVGTIADYGFAETFAIRRVESHFCSINYQDSGTRHATRCDDPALSEALFKSAGKKGI